MSEITKGFQLIREGSGFKTVDTNVDITTSRNTGVWLVDGDHGRAYGSESFRLVVGRHHEEDAARAYAAYWKADGHATAPVYRLFPLLSTEPIPETRLGANYEEVWAAFADAWIEVRL